MADHVTQLVLEAQPDPGQVYVDYATPLLQVDVCRWDTRASFDAGVVERYVERAVAVDGDINQAPNVVLITDIAF